MTLREEITLLAAALAILLGGALFGAVGAMIAQANGTPTTSERVMIDVADERPLNP